MCIYIYTRINIHINMFISIYMHIYIYIHLHLYIYMYIYTYMNIYINVFTCTHMYIHMYIHVPIYLSACICMYKCTCMRTYRVSLCSSRRGRQQRRRSVHVSIQSLAHSRCNGICAWAIRKRLLRQQCVARNGTRAH